MKQRESGKELSEQKDHQGPIDDLENQIPALVSTLNTFAECQRYRHTDDEKKERKD